MKNLRASLFALAIVVANTAQAQSLADAFAQGRALGSAANPAARAQIGAGGAGQVVPAYGTPAPQAALFGNISLTAPAAATTQACAAGSSQGCDAVNFSQTNPGRHAVFTIAPGDPLLAKASRISADPQSIAGNLAGTYSDCSVQTSTTPARTETALCHQYRTTETLACDKVLTVVPVQTPGCADGEFLARVLADPCPSCIDYIAFDFTCATGAYRMHVLAIEKSTGQTFMDLGDQLVPGALDTQIPKSPGPGQINAGLCYQTYYSQSCAGTTCSLGAWFTNPCQGTNFQGASSFVMPASLSLVDQWDNQCAVLEARAR